MNRKILAMTLITLGSALPVYGNDPCGMVPPIYTGKGNAISRIGLQQTFVFYKDGVESFVIRPGFTGKVDEFGMLIPFPSPPAIRKVPDRVFQQIANAVDPPEVVIDLRPRVRRSAALGRRGGTEVLKFAQEGKKKRGVRVLKQEAVGMYEVAVLEAGSAAALKKWMDKHGFKYPTGMDKVTAEYIAMQWCFVAVKTKVGQKQGADPQPAQRTLKTKLPTGSVFDGHVQGMGFRFETDELVVPMRLSAFNEGDLRNVVYLLTEGPRKIRSIPEEYVVRQLTGPQLVRNLVDPLPLRIIGGTEKDLTDAHRQSLKKERDPYAKNGVAKELFASDLVAVASGNLSLRHEEDEKELLRIGEHFGLRGPQIDTENAKANRKQLDRVVASAMDDLKKMTLTVVDGDFPREVLANQNLKFAEYRMPSRRNNAMNYDAKLNGPGKKKQGILKLGWIDWSEVDRQRAVVRAGEHPVRPWSFASFAGIAAILTGLVSLLIARKR